MDHFRWDHQERPSEDWKCLLVNSLGKKDFQIKKTHTKKTANKNSLGWEKS